MAQHKSLGLLGFTQDRKPKCKTDCIPIPKKNPAIQIQWRLLDIILFWRASTPESQARFRNPVHGRYQTLSFSCEKEYHGAPHLPRRVNTITVAAVGKVLSIRVCAALETKEVKAVNI